MNNWRGHKIIFIPLVGEWIYEDTGEPVASNINRDCNHCKLPCTPDGHDACIANLDGVSNACCGHGYPEDSYIQFENGITVRGFTIDIKGEIYE